MNQINNPYTYELFQVPEIGNSTNKGKLLNITFFPCNLLQVFHDK